MHTITWSLLLASLVAPCATAQRQPAAQVSLASLPVIGAITTDRGRISDLGAWSLTESPDGRFDAFAAQDSIRVHDRQTRTTTAIAASGVTELNWSRQGGMISFVRREENGQRVFPWILPVDRATGRASGPARQVSMRPANRFDEAAAFSPDDRFVAFAGNARDSGFVVVAPSNGGRERVLYSARGAANRAAISPDGKWVYFGAVTPGPVPQQTLSRVPFAGGSVEALAFLAPSSVFIGVSSDGKQLAWYGEGHPRSGATATIVVADANGKPLGIVRDVVGSTKSWSSKPGVLLSKKVDYTFATRVVSIDGGSIVTLGTPGSFEQPVAWSPDNRFLLARSGSATQWIVLTARGDTVRRFEGPRVASSFAPGWGGGGAAWSPDGRYVAYPSPSADGRHLASRLMLIETTTGRARALTEVTGEIGRIRWRSDGQGVQYVHQTPPSQSLNEVSLSGATRTVSSGYASARLAAIRPLTDSTVLVVTRDSMSLVSSQGKLIRMLQSRNRKTLGSLNLDYGVSGDGQRIAVIEDFEDSTRHAIHVIPTSGAPMRTISFQLDYDIQNPYFAGSDALVFLGNIHRSPMADHYADAFAVSLSGGIPRNLTAGDPITDVDDIRVSPDGKMVVYQAELGPIFPTRLIEIDMSAALRGGAGVKRN